MGELFDNAIQNLAEEISRRGEAFGDLSNGASASEKATSLRELSDRQQELLDRAKAEQDAIRKRFHERILSLMSPQQRAFYEEIKQPGFFRTIGKAPDNVEGYRFKYGFHVTAVDEARGIITVDDSPAPAPPLHPLELVVDGKTVGELLDIYDACKEDRPMRWMTRLQRDALSAEWSRQLREKQVAARVAERYQIVVQGEDD